MWLNQFQTRSIKYHLLPSSTLDEPTVTVSKKRPYFRTCTIIGLTIAVLAISGFCISGRAPQLALSKFRKPNGSIANLESGPYIAETEEAFFPEVAWLASFPNSGTSYTLDLTQVVSNFSTASNYKSKHLDNLDPSGSSIPVRPEYIDTGPYLHRVNYSLPKHYILTKTHCGGRCADCGPNKYVISLEDFQKECVKTDHIYTDKNGTSISEKVYYDMNIVKKVVHLIRDPFDNLVSRFRFHDRHYSEWAKNHGSNKTGFQAWCDYQNAKYYKNDKHHFSEKVMESIEGVPCHGEFYKYIKWHNYVLEITKQFNISTLVLHYEDFNDDLDGTVENLLNFLKLPSVSPPPNFYYNEYKDYYSDEQRDKAIQWMKRLSSNATLKILDYYSGIV